MIFSKRILFCFQEENGKVSAPDLVRKVEAGDISTKELYIGGLISQLPEITSLKSKICVLGVKEVLGKISVDLQKKL